MNREVNNNERSPYATVPMLSLHPAALDVIETLGLISELTTASDFNAALRAFPDCTVACPEPQA